jgi:hypothetical protein
VPGAGRSCSVHGWSVAAGPMPRPRAT